MTVRALARSATPLFAIFRRMFARFSCFKLAAKSQAGAGLWLLMCCVCACRVPELRIVERDNFDGGAEPAADSGSSQRRSASAGTSAADSGSAQRRSAVMSVDAGPSDAGDPQDASHDAGTRPTPPAAGSGVTMQPSAAGAAGAQAPTAGARAPEDAGNPARACEVWRSVRARDNEPPEGAIEGGLENIAGVSTAQYVCRVRPAASDFAVPGKYIVGQGCYVVIQRNDTPMDVSMLSGMFEVLTPAPGCTYSWHKASGSTLPAGAVDLGDPAGGPHYACHGFYSATPTSGIQIGVVIPTRDNPPQQRCLFQSFAGAVQPNDPDDFEVLVLDPA